MCLFKKKKSFVYSFSEAKGLGKDLLGGKGANLAEMVSMGLPIPMGFTITTEACDAYYKNNKSNAPKVLQEIEDHLQKLEKHMGKKLGDPIDPLLVSVRS
jgi:pyruvate, orthophosphate dikinase